MHVSKGWKAAAQRLLFQDTYLYLRGGSELRVENCRRILEYNEVLVRLRTADMTVEVWGEGLRVFDYNEKSVLVRGKISSIRLAEKGESHAHQTAL